MLVLQGDLKGKFFGIHLVKFHFVLLFRLQILNRLNLNAKKNYHSFTAFFFKGTFFFINIKGGAKKAGF